MSNLSDIDLFRAALALCNEVTNTSISFTDSEGGRRTIKSYRLASLLETRLEGGQDKDIDEGITERLKSPHGVVSLTREPFSGPIHFISKFQTIGDAEAYVARSPRIDAKEREEGRYCISAPYGLGNDLEARPLALKLGFDLFMSMGSAYFSKGPPAASMANWSRAYDNLDAAALAALATVD